MKLEDELQMGPIKDQHHRATLNVIFTGAWLGDKMNQMLKPFGISEQQYNILRILRGQKGSALNLQDISSRMIHKMSNTTRLVEKLRLKGMVERHVCQENRRKVLISITKAGLVATEKVDKVVKKSNEDLTTKITDKEATTLANLLDKIRE
jgi:DNA-binding MarR family transcriptional regulator